MRFLLLGLILYLQSVRLFSQNVQFTSNDPDLTEAFRWAKEQALSFAHDQDPVGPWYEAALPNREAFCMRDVAHQTTGASILGLDRHNLNILKKFASNISADRDYCSYWEINKYDAPAPVDYKNDDDFWYNLPANFDIVDACLRQYQWTGNADYIENDTLQQFYKLSLNEYVDQWQIHPNQILTRNRLINLKDPNDPSKSYYFKNRGIPTYNEGGRGETKLGIDLSASMRAGYAAGAELAKLAGHPNLSESYAERLREVDRFISEFWWDNKAMEFKSIWYEDDTFDYFLVGDNQAFTHYLLYFRAVNDSIQIQSILANYTQKVDELIVELASHIPDLFYKYGSSSQGNELIKKLSSSKNKRRDYPENSFAIIGDIITGLMGIEPDASRQSIRTLSRLQTSEDWAEVTDLPVLGGTINCRHESSQKTRFESDLPENIDWEVSFYGDYSSIQVNGSRYDSEQRKDNLGRTISFINVSVLPSTSATAEPIR